MIPIEDYTEVEEFSDSNQHYLLPKHPFRLLIAGASGTGKTNLLLNFIYDYLEFDNLFVCAKDMYEPKYAKLKEKYTMFDGVDFDKILVKYPKKKKIMLELFEKFGKKGTLFSSDTKEFITVDDLDPSCKNVVVFDDCMTDKDQRSIEDFFVRGRKKNATIIYLSQSYYRTPIIIRRNCNYLIFFNLQQREIQQIIREIDGSLTKEEFSRLYKKCMQQPYDFFMLDLVNPALRYRKKYFIPINKDGRVFAEENLRIQKKLPPLS
ncbi:uncharacterized protein TNCV_2557391 [Trichonephila clavipes]|nr:uncharacterized protein TNCV_2557391 [Trichonephila clavipes]